MSNEGIEIRGLRELRAAFRTVDLEIPKELRREFKTIGEAIIARVRARVPHRTGEAAGSLRLRATQTGVGIARPAGGQPWRGVRGAYYNWLDFGGKTGRGKRIERPFVKAGRYLYPAIAEARPELAELAADAVVSVARKHGFEVR